MCFIALRISGCVNLKKITGLRKVSGDIYLFVCFAILDVVNGKFVNMN